MNILSFGPVLLASVITVASGVAPVTYWFTPQIVQGGVLAVLSWTIWYVLARVLPAQHRALKEQRDAFLEAIKEEREATYDLYESLKTSPGWSYKCSD